MFLDVSEKEYHADRARYITSHSLIDFSRCPYGYMLDKKNPKEHKSGAFTFGTAAHVAILEPRLFSKRYIVCDGPTNEKTGRPYGSDTKKYGDWLREQPLPILSYNEKSQIDSMKKGLIQNDLAHEIISDAEGVFEGVIRKDFEGISCQSKLDYYSPDYGLCDLKTTQDIKWFESDSRKYGYIFQMAFYWHMLYLLTGNSVPVNIIAIEKVAPFRCGVFEIPQNVIKQAHELNVKNMKFMKRCIAEDKWPTLYEDPRQITSLF